MSDGTSSLDSRAAALRHAFDAAFAAPPEAGGAATEDLLAIRVGGEPHVLRLVEIAGLFVDKTITRVPGGAAALLGIAGFRGAILPAYDLATLLGRPARVGARWLVVASAAPVAFAFDAFDGHLRAGRHAIVRQEGAGEFLRANGTVRPLVHLPSVLGAISARSPGAPPPRER